jgi:hypothetical protein
MHAPSPLHVPGVPQVPSLWQIALALPHLPQAWVAVWPGVHCVSGQALHEHPSRQVCSPTVQARVSPVLQAAL